MAGETTNPGYIDAQSYANAPSGKAPDQAYQEHGRGINSYNLEQAGEAAKLASVITADTANGRIGINETDPDSTLHLSEPGDVTVGIKITNDTTGEGPTDGSVMQIVPTTNDLQIYNQESAPIRIGTNGTERARVDSSGNVLIGKTSASLANTGFEAQQTGVTLITRSAGRCLLLNRQTDDGVLVDFMQNDSIEGSISISGSTTAYNTTSDYRKKENIVDLTGATDRLKQIPVHRFNFIGNDKTVDGFIAHEVQAVVPEAVQGEKDAVDEDGDPVYQQIDQSKLVPLLVATIKELEARITALENG